MGYIDRDLYREARSYELIGRNGAVRRRFQEQRDADGLASPDQAPADQPEPAVQLPDFGQIARGLAARWRGEEPAPDPERQPRDNTAAEVSAASAPPAEQTGGPLDFAGMARSFASRWRGDTPQTAAQGTDDDESIISQAGTRASRYGGLVARIAREEGVPADALAAIMDTEDSDERSISVSGAKGLMQVVPGQGFDRPGEDAFDPATSIRQGARALREKHRMTGDWDEAGAAYFGYGTDPLGNTTSDYRDRYVANRARYRGAQSQGRPVAASGRPQPMPTTTPTTPDSGDLTPDQAALDDPDKWALCGPVAAVAMARARGGKWTVAEAKQYAAQNGLWNADQGMGGLEAEAKLLRGMGYAAKTSAADWDAISRDVATGNPVTLSTRFIPEGHYVVLEQYDPKTGRYKVGGLGGVLRKTTGRGPWYTAAELQELGTVEGALHFDNPATAAPSVAVADPSAAPTPVPSDSRAMASGDEAGDRQRAALSAGLAGLGLAPEPQTQAQQTLPIEDEYDPRDADSGPRESRPEYDPRDADGGRREAQPPYDPHTIVAPASPEQSSRDPGGAVQRAEDSQSRPGPAAVPSMKPLYDSRGYIIGYVAPGADERATPAPYGPEIPDAPYDPFNPLNPLGVRPLKPSDLPTTALPEGRIAAAPPKPAPPPMPRMPPRPFEELAPFQDEQPRDEPVATRQDVPTLPGASGRVVTEAVRAAQRSQNQTVSPLAVLQAIGEIPFDVYARARRELISDAEQGRMTGTDPLAPFRALGVEFPDWLSPEAINPEGRPAGDILPGLLLAGVLPDPSDPYVAMAFRGAGRAIGAANRSVQAAAREAVQPATRAAAPDVPTIPARTSAFGTPLGPLTPSQQRQAIDNLADLAEEQGVIRPERAAEIREATARGFAESQAREARLTPADVVGASSSRIADDAPPAAVQGLPARAGVEIDTARPSTSPDGPTPLNRAISRKSEIEAPNSRALARTDAAAARVDEQALQDSGATLQGTPTKYEFSSTQLDLPRPVARRIEKFGAKIPDAHLAEDGRESEIHLTTKYGLETNDVEDVRRVVEGRGPITVTLGKTDVFPASEAGGSDVVMVRADSPELRALNAELSKLPNGDTHPEYNPHITVAYVKPGKGRQYAGSRQFEGQQVTVERLTFSDRNGQQVEIPLTGEQRAAPRRVSERLEGQQRLTARKMEGPGAQAEAREYINRIHRHNVAPRGDKFRFEVVGEDGVRHGVAMVGRPNARQIPQDGSVLEVSRVATDGTPNASSALYGAARREARARGAERLITYTLESEPGTSLRAAGWTPVHVTKAESWNRGTRPREDVAPSGRKIRWEIDLTGKYPPQASEKALAILEQQRSSPTPSASGEGSVRTSESRGPSRLRTYPASGAVVRGEDMAAVTDRVTRDRDAESLRGYVERRVEQDVRRLLSGPYDGVSYPGGAKAAQQRIGQLEGTLDREYEARSNGERAIAPGRLNDLLDELSRARAFLQQEEAGRAFEYELPVQGDARPGADRWTFRGANAARSERVEPGASRSVEYPSRPHIQERTSEYDGTLNLNSAGSGAVLGAASGDEDASERERAERAALGAIFGAVTGGRGRGRGKKPPTGLRRSPPTVEGEPPRGQRALPPAGGTTRPRRSTDDLIAAAHRAVGVPEKAPALDPGKLERWRRDFVRAWTDNRVDLAEMQNEARRLLGRRLTGEEMIYEASRVNPSGAAKVAMDEHVRPILTGLDSEKPAVTITDSEGNTVTLTETQVLSRMLELVNNRDTALALNSPGRMFPGGLTGDESGTAARALLEKLPRETQIRLGRAANAISDVVDLYRERLVDAGVWSRELGDQMKEQYPFWTPTRILDFMRDEGQPGAATIRTISLNDRHLRAYSFEGTSRKREDGIASLIRYVQQAEEDIAKNRTFNAFYQLRENVPGWSDAIREVKADTPVETPKGEKAVTGWVNGERRRFIVPAPMAAAIQMEQQARIPGVAAVTRGFRELITRTPFFVAGQIPLDALSYVIRESAREGGPQHAPRVLGALLGGYQEAFRGLTDGTFHGDTARYLETGGAMAGYYQRSAQAASTALDDVSRRSMFQFRNAGDVAKTLKWLATLEPVSVVGQRVELAPRTASFRLGRERAVRRGLADPSDSRALVAGDEAGAMAALPERTRTTSGIDERAADLTAMTGARDVTMDFQRGGNWSMMLNQIVPFFNIGTQGTATPWRSFKESGGAYASTVVALVGAPMVAIEAWNRSDEQRARDYDDVPDYVKDRGAVIMTGTSWTDKQGNRHPQYVHWQTRELAPFAIFARELAGRTMGALGVGREVETRAWGDVFTAMLKAGSPIQANSAADLFSTATPIGASTGAQLAYDYDAFRDRPIATERSDDEAGVIARGLSDASGGKLGRPSQIEFALRDTTGNVGAAVLAGADLGASLLGKVQPGQTPKSLERTPVIGSVTSRFSGSAIGGRLERARERMITPSLEAALTQAGMRPDQVSPVSNRYRQARLTVDEQARWQQAFNAEVDEAVFNAQSAREWDDPSTRKTALSDALSKARQRAARDALGLSSADIQDRLDRERYSK